MALPKIHSERVGIEKFLYVSESHWWYPVVAEPCALGSDLWILTSVYPLTCCVTPGRLLMFLPGFLISNIGARVIYTT